MISQPAADALPSQALSAAPPRRAIHTVERDGRGRNATLFRHVNERIRRLGEKYEFGDLLEMVCECGAAACHARIAVGRDAYDELRADITHFLVRPEHEHLAVGHVVKRRDGYLIISRDGE